MDGKVVVIGAGLAGSEAACQLSRLGINVLLYEMKPVKFSPAHHSAKFAELVCSNSLRSNQLENAVGVLKEELRQQGSLIMEAADQNRVPAGGALAVDRSAFSDYITQKLEKNQRVEIRREEVTDLSQFDLEQDYILLATGPLTSSRLLSSLTDLLGDEELYFFDAVAPVVEAASIDRTKSFLASRYDKGDGEYINCPLTETEYELFYRELLEAKRAQLNDFDDHRLFQGCMPVEAIARQGQETLLFGPMKPVGLVDPRTGKKPYAVVQLRQDNQAASLYNLVGFQTQLTWPEQKRVFRLIPALQNAVFERFGVMHKNSFINSPRQLQLGFQHKEYNKLFFAGQITGVEGYVESTASGLVAAKSLAASYLGIEDHNPLYLHPETVMGGLAHYVVKADPRYFQPMNANFGLLPELSPEERQRLRARYGIREKGRRGRRLLYAKRALEHYNVAETKKEGQTNAQE